MINLQIYLNLHSLLHPFSLAIIPLMFAQNQLELLHIFLDLLLFNLNLLQFYSLIKFKNNFDKTLTFL
jgi:hypothetical protein